MAAPLGLVLQVLPIQAVAVAVVQTVLMVLQVVLALR
jgi:hypothetical protein